MAILGPFFDQRLEPATDIFGYTHRQRALLRLDLLIKAKGSYPNRCVGVLISLPAAAGMWALATKPPVARRVKKLSAFEPPESLKLADLAPWGRAPTPLLPRAVREQLSGVALPAQLSLIFKDAVDLSELDYAVWGSVESVPDQALVTLASQFGSISFRNLSLMQAMSWSVSADHLEYLPLTERAERGLKTLLTSSVGFWTEGLTFADLFAVNGITKMAALEISCVLEAAESFRFGEFACRTFPHAETTDVSRKWLAKKARKGWAGWIHEYDQSIQHLVGQRTFADYLAELAEQIVDGSVSDQRALRELTALPDIVADIEGRCSPFDVALLKVAQDAAKASALPSVVSRLGLSGEPPTSLQVAGDVTGLTRERVRQLSTKVVSIALRDGSGKLSLLRAHDILLEQAPISVAAATQLLLSEQLVRGDIRPETCLFLLRQLGIASQIAVRDGQVIHVEEQERPEDPRISMISKLSRPFGFIHTEVLAELVSERSVETVGSDVVEIVQKLGGYELSLNWVFLPSHGNRKVTPFVRLLQKMVTAAGQAVLATDVRAAVRRRHKFRRSGLGWVGPVPPESVVLDAAESLEELSVSDGGRIDAEVTDFDDLFGDTEQRMIEALAFADGGVLDRSSLLAELVEVGVSANTASIYLSYSPIIAPLSYNVWGIRGAPIDFQAIDVLRADLRESRQNTERRTDIRMVGASNIRVRYRLPQSASIAVYVTTEFHGDLAEREFEALDENSKRVGVVKFNETGNSWGYGPFLLSEGAEPEDVLEANFDLVTQTVELSLVEEL